MSERQILTRHAAHRDDIGDLVTRRPVPGPGLDEVDPFLFLNHHGPQVYPPNNRGLPFGPHPHRGFETITFILEGELSHLDSGGHESIIRAGGVQRMTAGSGLVHAELSPAAFKAAGGPLEILQLWLNLPSRLKMTTPSYLGLQREDIPVIETGGAEVQLISGSFGGATGPAPSLTGVFMSVVTLAPGACAGLPAAPGRSVFLYVVRGEIDIAGKAGGEHQLLGLSDGDGVEVSSTGGAVLLFGHADPIGEPVFAHGPFVMNTREEIIQAIADYNAGKFGVIA